MKLTMQCRGLVLIAAYSLIAISSCVSSKKFKSLTATYESSQADLTKCRSDNSTISTEKQTLSTDKQTLEAENAGLKKQSDEFSKQVDYLKQNNTVALQQLQDMSVISKQQAESIEQSLQNIGAKDSY